MSVHQLDSIKKAKKISHRWEERDRQRTGTINNKYPKYTETRKVTKEMRDATVAHVVEGEVGKDIPW